MPTQTSPRFSKIFGALPSIHKATEVVPLGFVSHSSSVIDASIIANAHAPHAGNISFHEAFGILGPPIVLIVLGCIAWTCWLITLSIAPNTAANYLLNTSELDDGHFWLIPDECSTLQIFSVAGLVLVLAFYLYILLKVLVWRERKNVIQNKLDSILIHWKTAAGDTAWSLGRPTLPQRAVNLSWHLYVHWKAFTGIHGKNRKFWVHDLVMLALLLRDLLEAGTPLRITYGFAALAALNSLSCAAGIVYSRCSALVEILVDTLFDFSATVIYPLTVLHYCSENFHYDRAVFFINLELLPIGSFERRARMYANPAEVALVRTSFDSLRILDQTDFVLRIGMNLAFSYRFKRIVEVLIDLKVGSQQQIPRTKLSLLHPELQSNSSLDTTDKQITFQRSVPRPLTTLFVAYSVGVLVVTHQAISTSQTVCFAQPECVVYAYRWRDAEFCPCRALIDGNRAPKTYDEWTHPVDAASTVKALASAGTLETLQLVNRQLMTLPDELRGCHNLNYISLINCATQELPSWMKDFRKLQFLQIEGKVGSENLGDLARDIFSDMPELRYLQLGVHQHMSRLPPLDGAPGLRSIIFSRLYNLVEFSSLKHQTGLERLELTSCKSLPSLPDLQTSALGQFVIFQGAFLCCNGFLSTCDLTNPFCKTASCHEDSSQRATQATQQAFQKFSDSVCQPYSRISQVPTAETIQVCDGVSYRKCHLPGLEPNTSAVGMCYNHRMQVLACNPDPDKIQVRRRQIQESVGDPCDPDEEFEITSFGSQEIVNFVRGLLPAKLNLAEHPASVFVIVQLPFAHTTSWFMKTTPAKAAVVHRGARIRKFRPSLWKTLLNAWRRFTSSEVAPVGPTLQDIPPSKTLVRGLTAKMVTLHRKSVVAISLRYLSFQDAFGVLGPPMVVVALVCISWTLWLIILTVAPNQTANYLMNTGDYDDGQFWLIPEKLTTLQVFSVLGLVMVAFLYIYVLLKMLVWRAHQHAEGTILDRILQHCAPDHVDDSGQLEFSHRVRLLIWQLYTHFKELTGFRGKYRKLWNLCLKGFDLAMQTFVLSGLLEAGTPVLLSLGFAVFIALNSASCAVAIVSGKHSAFAEILLDSLFDLSATVLFPILVLVYCAHTFDYDHEVFHIYMELMPVGSFERRARMFANPTEIELFRVSFDSLRIRSVPDLFLRIGMNLGFSYRFKRVVEVLIQMQTQRQRDLLKKRKPVILEPTTMLTFPRAVSGWRACQKSVPRSIAILFVAYSASVVVVTHQAITTSQTVCHPHPECVVFAYRWRDTELCPCRALVDGDRAPKTYDEWTHPVDITDTVKALAAAGTLETFQLINRQLIVLPEELRGCRNLNFISIVNCAIEELPVWASEFYNLEYLQIEGKVGSANLKELPPHLFSAMPRLRYIQLGLHQRMVRLPSLDGAPSLCCLILARMAGMTELPSFARLTELERLEFTVMKQLPWLPDLAPVGPIVHLAVYQGAYLCCNGFLGSCDLTNPFCKATNCLEDASLKATAATLQVFQEFSDGVCQPYNGVSQTPTAETIQMCDGVPFRQCQLQGLKPNTTVVGMCYNHRMQVLACNPDPAKIQVRIRQIKDGVETPCDPAEEAWLGCTKTTEKLS